MEGSLLDSAPHAKRVPLQSTALALGVAGLLAAAPAGAFGAPPGGTTVVHSAESGEFQGGRPTLRGRGIGRRVSWVHNSGRSGLISVARMHRRLFGPGTRPATGLLHIAGRPAGRELALRLSRPRHSAAGHWVSYRAKRLTKRAGGRRAARASRAPLPRRFGAASLSLVGGPPVGQALTRECSAGISNRTNQPLVVASASKWDTDDWLDEPTIGHLIRTEPFAWASEAGAFRGCSNTLVFQLVSAPFTTFTITTSDYLVGLPQQYLHAIGAGLLLQSGGGRLTRLDHRAGLIKRSSRMTAGALA